MLGVIDEIPLLVLGHLISLSTVSCVLHARFRAFFKNSSVGGPTTKRDHTIPSVEK